MPGLLKIGMTDAEDVGQRTGQLYSSGVSLSFTVEFAASVPGPRQVEDALLIAFAPHTA